MHARTVYYNIIEKRTAYIIRLRELIAIYTPDIIRPNSTQYNNNKYVRTR